MTREEFSKKLVECREAAGYSKYRLCKKTGLTQGQLQRIEKALNNYGIDSVFTYLHSISYNLFINQKNARYKICNRDELSNVFKKIRSANKISQRELSEAAKVSYIVITGIEYGNKNTSIDSLLLCVSALGCEIELVI